MSLSHLKTLSKKIFCSLIVAAFLSPGTSLVYAQNNAATPAVISDYLDQYGFDKVPSGGGEAYAIYGYIQDFLKEKELDNRDPKELNEWIESDDLKNQFIDSFSTYLTEELTSPDYNPQPLPGENVDSNASNDPTKPGFQLVPVNCEGSGKNKGKDYGDCGWKDLIFLINTAVKFLVYIAASLSAMAFAYAGFLYMTAFGNSGKIEQAHGIFSKTMIGILFVLTGWLIVYTILIAFGVNISEFSLLQTP